MAQSPYFLGELCIKPWHKGNSQSCRANLMKTKEIHHPTSFAQFALCMIRARSTLISKVVECFSPSLLEDGRLVMKQGKE